MADKKTTTKGFGLPGIPLPFNLPFFKGQDKGKGAGTPPEKRPALVKLVIFIVEWAGVRAVGQALEAGQTRFHTTVRARGTASSDVLDLLGLGATDKGVVLCLEEARRAPRLLREARVKLNQRQNAGIAFTIPLSGINSPLLMMFENAQDRKGADNMKDAKESQDVKTEIRSDLILAVINQGYSDEFMAVARKAGARGGTVINARGQAHDGAVKFFGIQIQNEREIVLILTSRDEKAAIMQAVSQACGLDSKAGGIVFSLPVDTVLGLSFE